MGYIHLFSGTGTPLVALRSPTNRSSISYILQKILPIINWAQGVISSREFQFPPNPTWWIKLVDMIKFMWGTGFTPKELGWTVLVLIPNGNMDTWGIGLLEVVWKVVEAVIDTRIKSVVQFHDVLHWFCAGRGAGTAIMELKVAQDLASVYQNPLFLLLLVLRRAYDNLDWGRLLKSLEGHGSVPKLQGLLVKFWSIQEVFTCQNGFHGPQFRATRGTTQGGIDLPTLFNLSVDSVVHHWMSLTVED